MCFFISCKDTRILSEDLPKSTPSRFQRKFIFFSIKGWTLLWCVEGIQEYRYYWLPILHYWDVPRTRQSQSQVLRSLFTGANSIFETPFSPRWMPIWNQLPSNHSPVFAQSVTNKYFFVSNHECEWPPINDWVWPSSCSTHSLDLDPQDRPVIRAHGNTYFYLIFPIFKHDAQHYCLKLLNNSFRVDVIFDVLICVVFDSITFSTHWFIHTSKEKIHF